jgi:hypothetical protein
MGCSIGQFHSDFRRQQYGRDEAFLALMISFGPARRANSGQKNSAFKSIEDV